MNRVYHPDGKTPALMQGTGGRTLNILTNTGEGRTRIRRLTPTECAHLQTVPDWYKWVVSETQQYKMLGNGWTVEVIKHIFSFFARPFQTVTIMATTTLHFKIPRTELPGVFALMEAEDTPAVCELRIKKANAGVREIEVTTDDANANYFRDALGGGRDKWIN